MVKENIQLAKYLKDGREYLQHLNLRIEELRDQVNENLCNSEPYEPWRESLRPDDYEGESDDA